MFINIGDEVKNIEATIESVKVRVSELEKLLLKESCFSRKNSMQSSRKAGLALIKALENQIKEIRRFL